jgi:hypothetical protein
VGIVVPNLYPLPNCPSLPIWLGRSGQIYRVFVDETYLQFFELNSRGYFCHGAIGIPELEPGTADRLLDVDIASDSKDEIGLQMADPIAEEGRRTVGRSKRKLSCLLPPRSELRSCRAR